MDSSSCSCSAQQYSGTHYISSLLPLNTLLLLLVSALLVYLTRKSYVSIFHAPKTVDMHLVVDGQKQTLTLGALYSEYIRSYSQQVLSKFESQSWLFTSSLTSKWTSADFLCGNVSKVEKSRI